MKWGSLVLLLTIWNPALLCNAQGATSSALVATSAPSSTSGSVDPLNTANRTGPAAGLPIDGSYIIGASDVITVTVLKETTLSSSLLVRPDGMITMPLLGDVKAAGLTPLQLATDITTRLKKYFQDPNVSVILTQINSKKVYLMGEVTKVGPVDLTPGMTLLEAIANASGLTQYANAKKMYILRSEDGKHAKIPVHYKEALKGHSALDLALKPGDTIVVP